MFEPKLNFRFYSDFRSDIAICMNRSPEPGEQPEYLLINEGAKRTVYAAVAFVPNLNDAGRVLIIAGTSSGAQGIAAEFLTTENLLSPFMNRLSRSQNRIPFFEVLIRTVTLAGVAQEPEVIAYRVRERVNPDCLVSLQTECDLVLILQFRIRNVVSSQLVSPWA
jgi:hypothetical protein